jgi:hypothetical protein
MEQGWAEGHDECNAVMRKEGEEGGGEKQLVSRLSLFFQLQKVQHTLCSITVSNKKGGESVYPYCCI